MIEIVAAHLRKRAAVLMINNAEIARQTGIPPQTVHRYMTGERDIPMSAFFAFASVLGIDMNEVMATAEGNEK